jgi:hypothetical protein
MIHSYPARYQDAQGEEHTIIENNGKRLRMVVRGVGLLGQISIRWNQRLIRLIRAWLPLPSWEGYVLATWNGGCLCP